MAWTETKTVESVFGNLRVKVYELTADSATLELDTGFGDILGLATAPKSMASSPYSVKRNALSAGTSSAGYVAITGCTSGDDLYLTVYGR